MTFKQYIKSSPRTFGMSIIFGLGWGLIPVGIWLALFCAIIMPIGTAAVIYIDAYDNSSE